MKIKKAVIPAAGLGTRVLPASKAMPKEMLPIVDKPAIQYIVEEAVKSGIEDILIITSRGKTTVEDHFDRAPELEDRLLRSGKQQAYDEIVAISKLANIQYIRQKETKGLGHAVLCAKTFVGGDPFAVLYGDDVILSETPVCKQLCDAYEEFGLGVAGMKEVPTDQILKYCSLAVENIRDNLYKVTDMIEKPSREQLFSNFAILGRTVLPASIFEILENTPYGAGGELQLTDAMRTLAKREGMVGVDFEGTRYDMGNKLGILQAIVEVGLIHPEVGSEFKEYLKKVTSRLS
ncbi:UTP--glucose-1-phosphate uridylyltransferase GalU [Candidatus Soleaferrea massiliensis]|uniref:UTP--glucose-1-phosphate uridylyltransferase GalU n=1 Tax=Candidatus Soleaferrea massiliensis TaxID=1470354 RepID=UPI00058EB364|nr:UTP--glucose-1-phosphate uridylyltransferase GalU [Candidatus Soleaferrea massiliensis]